VAEACGRETVCREEGEGCYVAQVRGEVCGFGGEVEERCSRVYGCGEGEERGECDGGDGC
jgi:hypothetical protein